MKNCWVWLRAAALLLAGCGKKTASQAESLRQRYRDMQAVSSSAAASSHTKHFFTVNPPFPEGFPLSL